MKTPITDAAWDRWVAEGLAIKFMDSHRRLELDRAALMEALERIERLSSDGWAKAVAEDALDSARANFPNA
jgi:hypothetical protein